MECGEMTYEEFEKSVVVEPTRDYVSGDMVSVELRFQAGCRARRNKFAPFDEETFIEHLKRELYDNLFVRQVPLTLVEQSGMTEEEFVNWCRQKMYEDMVIRT